MQIFKRTVIIFLVFSAVSITVYAAKNATPPDKKFTTEELAKYDGSGEKKAYVAIDGIIYNVTLIKAWAGGKHKHGLRAGKDLSKWIKKAPHGKKVLKILPKVGTLK